ncbi:hypothetical protein Agub_g263 [Astrephomene gubernaculifera]|uniref:phosphoribosylaminoimidazole carboxylase n=1 Tax=Astrephomene gubernaculifera TaxID=47775 RepID=A0AAD3DDR7_9CHLO|nr:hypothetical protein Agub_g263 [Astrephomene gubernaculifera]
MLAVHQSHPTTRARPAARTGGARRRCGTRRSTPLGAGGAGAGSTNSTTDQACSHFSNGMGLGAASAQITPEFNLESLAPPVDSHQTPEVVWGPGKSAEEIAVKLLSLTERQRVAVAARIDPATYSAVRLHAPGVEYNARARTLKLRSATAEQLPRPMRFPGSVAIVSADTADLAVAEEVRVLADYLGAYCFPLRGMGSCSLHALLSNVDSLRAADVVVVVTGMDCSLPGVVAGLTPSPVVAVPTSAGSGASLGGVAPLLSTLGANTPGVAVCNIDNGYGAAAMAVRMLKMATRLHVVRSAAEAAAAAARSVPSNAQN